MDLIRLYQSMLTAQRILQARLRDEQVALAALRVAEVEAQGGKTAPYALAQISSIYTNSKTLTERERNELIIAVYQLEALVGQSLQSLKARP